MADTIRHKILKDIVLHLRSQPWLVFNSITVYPGKRRYLPEELPGISVFAMDESGERNQYDNQHCTFQVEVKYVGTISRDDDGEKADIFDMAEVLRGRLIDAMINVDLEELADPPVYSGGNIDYPATEDQEAQISIFVTIDYETQLRDPYAQEEED
jgi:hypothetical protein